MSKGQMRLSVMSILCLVVLLSASCVNDGAGTNSFCLASQPILISKQDVLTGETARQILQYNMTGAEFCGWGR